MCFEFVELLFSDNFLNTPPTSKFVSIIVKHLVRHFLLEREDCRFYGILLLWEKYYTCTVIVMVVIGN